MVRGTLQLFLQYDLGTRDLDLHPAHPDRASRSRRRIALPLGVLMGAFEPINRIFEPIMAPLRYMPISAFIPLLILWFGIYESQKIAFLFLGVFVYLLPVVVTAIRAVPEELVQTALTLGASRWQVVRTVLLPAALPEIFDSFRVMNAISWTYVILAEAVNPEHGLGYMVELARTHQKASWSFAGLLVIGGIGLLTDALHPRLLGGAVPLEGEGGMSRGRVPKLRRSRTSASPTSAATAGRPKPSATCRSTSPTSRASARSSCSSARPAAASPRSSRRSPACCRPTNGEVLVDGEQVDGPWAATAAWSSRPTRRSAG